MPEINILPKEVYQLIAAGEVVERPSSVVKEMIENSVDAGARNITIEIKNGGSTYIRITDDGCGIAKSEVKKVFVSHATSKIKVQDDLDSIATLGFRGEAMASISAVAKVELLSRTADEDLGTRYEIAGGEELDFSDAGCPIGTTIVVRDIFFNTPARMKFLKKDVTEGNSVAGIVDRMAISHPEISFRFIRDGKQTLITSGNGDLKSTIYSVFGRDFSQSLIDVDYTVNNMRVTGVVTKPSASRKSRAMQFFFINSRLVKCQTAMAALEQAYRNSIMVGRFPGCVLNIECDNSFVDVNVHPAKIEVRFANEKPVFELIYYGVKSAVEAGDTPKEVHFEAKNPVQTTINGKLDFFMREEDKPQQMEFRQKSNPDNFWQVAASQPKYEVIQDDEPSPVKNTEIEKKADDAPVINIQEREPVSAETKAVQPEIEIPDFRVIGETFKTYIIVEIENALYLIDKHAAHERINFEKLKSSSVINSQILLSPVTVRLSKEEYSVVCDNLDLYKKCGFLVEDFGSSTVIVRECPSILNGEDIEDLICETASKLLDGKTDITPDQMDWIFHSTSCRAAVKAGDYTSPYERDLFVKKLLSMPNIRYCPHGRPVMIKMTKYDIEKQFGRIQ
ncbi:MAG: DNA mismatch repair endonuclease MutL [Eubacterium sp.]